jgi:hypothetical protein
MAAWQVLLVGLSLGLFFFFIADLALHPLSPSDGPILLNDRGTTFRYFSVLAGALNIAVGLLVMRKAPGNTLGILLILMGAMAAGWSTRSDWANLELAGWIYLTFYIFFFGFAWPAFGAFLYLYPSGYFYPAWIRPWALAALSLTAVIGLAANLALPEFGASGIRNPVQIPWLRQNLELMGIFLNLVSLVAIFGPLVALVARFRQAEWLVRQQIKWLVWLVAVTAGMSVISLASTPSTASVQSQPPVFQLLSFAIFILYQSLGAIASASAILRHRLWDIDVVIRKTLVYSLLTGLLGLVYFGGVALLQGVLTADRGPLTAGDQAVSGSPSAVVIVITTLAIAALFNPLRRRVQDFIDRRFYRQRYDAEKALAEFAAAARSEADLMQLASRLTGTVQEALQPERVSLYLINMKSG